MIKPRVEEVNCNDEFFQHIESVTPEEEHGVTRLITLADLERTLTRCQDSAPGPDGISYSFYKALWRTAGPLLVEAWNYSLSIGKLCTSHKVSFLKLIPKVGKDTKKLTNWRPITLSNCDHKIITKTYADRMSLAVAQKLKERQTAYLKGRLINDNIRAILTSIELTNSEEDLDGLIVSLDAKKAFDSVEHKYIEESLKKFGLESFVPIFRTLYSDLRSDIIINGRIVNGFRICRGVKQGDALSCILFIICMEPLLRNIEENPRIRCINSRKIGPLPKAYAYADDVNVIIENSAAGLQTIFDEYSRLTKASGLELNADKTEIMQLRRRNQNEGNFVPTNFDVVYCGQMYQLNTSREIKVNGILFQQNTNQAVDANVDNVLGKIDKILRNWSARHLSLLGKILIVKTFAISQVIYLLQSLVLNDSHFKRINAMLYKFIWNKRYLAAKAPERISREVMNKPIKYGGLGMLDLCLLDKSLKLKALGRLSSSEHPLLKKISESLALDDYFHPSCGIKEEKVIAKGIEIIKEVRKKYVGHDPLLSNRLYIAYLKNVKLKNLVNPVGRQSLQYFRLVTGGVRTLGQLDVGSLQTLNRFIERNFFQEAMRVLPLPGDTILMRNSSSLNYVVKGRFIELSKLSSRDIRLNLTNNDPLCSYKIGIITNPATTLAWGSAISKLTSVRHRSIILRTAHGEIYTKERLHIWSDRQPLLPPVWRDRDPRAQVHQL